MIINLSKRNTVLVPLVVGTLAAVIMHLWLQSIDPVVVAILPDGGEYSGEMVDGKLQGEGVIRWPNGAIYSGSFENGLSHGKGHFSFANGAVYEGKFSKGMMHGFGTLKGPNIGVYDGEFYEDKINGSGHWKAPGFEYRGELKKELFHGQGDLSYPDGSRYVGEFRTNLFHGKGIYTSPSGEIYSGQFKKGQFTGQGSYTSEEQNEQYVGGFLDWRYNGKGTLSENNGDIYIGSFLDGSFTGDGQSFSQDGAQYTGQFQDWYFHGKGIYTTAEGDVFDGHFKDGYYDGTGSYTLSEEIDGIGGYTGVWQGGRLVESEVEELVYNPEEAIGQILYSQSHLLEDQLNNLAENDEQKQELYFVGIGGDGSQEVFRREILFTRDLFNEQFNQSDHSVVLINSRRTYRDYPLATMESIKQALEQVADKMDRDNDVLFLYLSSHGSKDHQFYLNQPSLPLSNISADALGQTLSALNIRNKVVVISACYSGGFIPKLNDGNSIVITSAREDRTSFGCADRNKFTYFGQAYFKEGVAEGLNFFDAFDNAEKLVTKWEKDESVTPSEPQILKPEAVTQRINSWFSSTRLNERLSTNN